jgi:hypothetical protein
VLLILYSVSLVVVIVVVVVVAAAAAAAAAAVSRETATVLRSQISMNFQCVACGGGGWCIYWIMALVLCVKRLLVVIQH